MRTIEVIQKNINLLQSQKEDLNNHGIYSPNSIYIAMFNDLYAELEEAKKLKESQPVIPLFDQVEWAEKVEFPTLKKDFPPEAKHQTNGNPTIKIGSKCNIHKTTTYGGTCELCKKIKRPDYYDLSAYNRLEDLIAPMPMFRGTAFKYLLRAGKKDGESEIKDITKAIECLQIELERLNKENENGL